MKVFKIILHLFGITMSVVGNLLFHNTGEAISSAMVIIRTSVTLKATEKTGSDQRTPQFTLSFLFFAFIPLISAKNNLSVISQE